MPLTNTLDMKFCRRCGGTFTESHDFMFRCANGHTIYVNPAPAVGLILEDSQGNVVAIKRGQDPGKDQYDLPGGFCDGNESLEQALAREIEEELGLKSKNYTQPQYVTSGVDPYNFGGETVLVLSTVFHAKLVGQPKIKAGDDAASVELQSPTKEYVDQQFFAVLRAALEKHYL